MQMEKNQMTKTFRNIEFFESLEVTGYSRSKNTLPNRDTESKKENKGKMTQVASSHLS